MPASPRRGKLKAELLLFAMTIVWAINYSVAKYGLTGIDIFVFNSIRYVVATATIILMMLPRWEWRPIARRDVPQLLQAGVIASVIYQVAFVVSLNLTTAGNSAVLLSTSPLWTVFLHARMHREKIRLMMWLGMLLSFAGVIMIVIGSGTKMVLGGHELIGDIVCLAAAALWGLSTNLQTPLLTRYSPMQLALIMIATGAVGLTFIAIPPMTSIHWATIHWSFYAATVASGIFSIGIANVVWSYGIRQLGPGRTANFNNLVPVMAFAFSYYFLHDVILPIQIAGAAITIIGVWIVRQ